MLKTNTTANIKRRFDFVLVFMFKIPTPKVLYYIIKNLSV